MALEQLRCFVGHSFYDGSCCVDRVYETSGFAKPDSGIIWVALRKRQFIAWPLDSDVTLELFFATVPAVSECVAANPTGEPVRPGELSDDIRCPRTQRGIAI